jgi:hypothetical protein
MSCDAAALALSLHFAALEPAPGLARLLPISTATAPANPLAAEPLFADIVTRAGRLQRQADAWRSAPLAAPPAAFEAQVGELAALDMQGHETLAKRGTDGDLKCILKGIAQDLPKKLADLKAAATPADRKGAAEELFYLLRDNVEVVTTPPKAQSSDVLGL